MISSVIALHFLKCGHWVTRLCLCEALVVYISDQVRALENEMLENLQLKGLDFIPRIVIVRPDF